MPERNWLDNLRALFTDRLWTVWKAFRTGPAVVERAEQDWGHDQTVFAPEAYGEYIATSAAVYACANLRAKNLAKLPLRLWRINAHGKRQETAAGELYELLQKVNPYWTFGRLVRMTELARCLWGNGYWMLERGRTGRRPPSEIWWARPDRVKVLPHPVDYISGFVFENLGERIPFLPGEVVWLRMDNPIDEFSGLSPLASARLSADLGTAGLRSNKNLFDQGLQLGGIIAPDDPNTRWDAEKVKEIEGFIAKRLKGVDKAHRWAVFSGGIKATPLGVNPKDAEFINQMKWSLGDVARVYLIPPELVGDHEHATYSNIDQAYKGFWSDCLEPEAAELAEEITEQLLPLFPGQADLAEFDFSGVPALQEDRSEVVKQMATLWAMAVPLNKLLEEFMPQLLPAAGGGYPWGEMGYLPGAVQPTESTVLPAPAEPPPATPQEGVERALRLVAELKALPEPTTKALEYGCPEHERRWKAFTRRTDRHEAKWQAALADLFARQQESVLARLEAGKPLKGALPVEDEPFDRAKWGKRFKQLGLPLLREILDEAGAETVDDLAVATSWNVSNPAVVRWLEGRAQRFARQVNETTWQQLRQSLAEGIGSGEGSEQLVDRVRAVFREATTARAQNIARTETTGAANAGSLLAAKQVEDGGAKVLKGWLAALDERTRETHREAHRRYQAKPIPLGEDFRVGAGNGPAPGQIGLAEEDCQCRCTVTYEIVEETNDGRLGATGAGRAGG